jgi:hypothetical protein
MTSTVPPDGASLHRYPRTSCLATINLSLRDKSHSPIEAPHNFLSAYGFNPRLNPRLNSSAPPGQYNIQLLLAGTWSVANAASRNTDLITQPHLRWFIC